MKIKSFHDLHVWQKAMDLTDAVYDLTDSFPKREWYGLVNQINRSAVSVPSNIAEGSGRNSTKELLQFLYISRGSLAELYTQVEIGRRRKFGKMELYPNIFDHIRRVSQMTSKLILSLQSTNTTTTPTTNHDYHEKELS